MSGPQPGQHPPPETAAPGLRTTSRFAGLLAVLMVALLLAVFAVFLSVQREKVVEATSAAHAIIARTFLNSAAPILKDSDYLSTWFFDPDATTDSETKSLDDIVRSFVEGTRILKVVVIDASGNRVYSSDQSDEEQQHWDSAEFWMAMRGSSTSALLAKQSINRFGTIIIHRDVVETYLPIDGMSGGTVGVIELFTDVTDELASAEAKSLNRTLLFVPPFFLVYGIALWFVSRGEREALKRQKALEKARMEAEQANSAKSEFLAVMSHEIRTPLSGIVGLTDLLIEDAETPERRSKHLMVRSACDNLLRVVDDVLDLSKIEAGAMVIAPSMTHMPLFTEALLGLYAPRARAKGVRIIADVDRSVPQQVFVDGTRLSQILGNLLGNAVKFTAEGRVDLHLRTEALAQDDRSGGQAGTLLLIARVSDTGPGMSAEKLAGLFRRYEQGDATTQKNFGGTGLGLFICAELCRLMGGRIKASSSEGNGSQFEVQLPVRLTAEPVVAKADPIASATDQDDSAGGADRALSTSGAGPQDADSDGAGAQDATNPEAEQTPADHAGRTAPGNGKAAVSPAGPDADAEATGAAGGSPQPPLLILADRNAADQWAALARSQGRRSLSMSLTQLSEEPGSLSRVRDRKPGEVPDIALVQQRDDGLWQEVPPLLANGLPGLRTVLVAERQLIRIADRARDLGYDAILFEPVEGSPLNDLLGELHVTPSATGAAASAQTAGDASLNGGVDRAEPGGPHSAEAASGLGGALAKDSAAGRGGSRESVEAASNRLLRHQRKAATGQPFAEPYGRPLRVMVVDDNEVNRSMLKAMVERLGGRVDLAEDGEDAVLMAESERFDVILMDIQMPRLDGIGATREIRNRMGPNRAIPILGITADALPATATAGLEAGMSRVLTKPVRKAELATAVKACLADGIEVRATQ